jgi:predicted PurR-regulated permease PerM
MVQPLFQQFGVTNVNLKEILVQNQESIAKNLSGPLANGLKSFAVTIVTLIISLLTTFFMIRDSHHMLEPVTDLIPLPREETRNILSRMAATVRSVFIAVVVVALIQGTVMGIAYLITGVEGWLVWTLITTVLCMIPLLGSPVVILPISVSLFLQGKIWQGCVVLGIGFGIVTQIDNFLRPIFISGETKIHPMAIFFSLLGGVLVLGPVGLMAGPMLLTLILAFVDVARVRKRLEESGEVAPA